jgi:hypothetical protein
MTDTSTEITSSVRRREPATVKLDGVPYTMVPPKKAVMMLPVYTGEGTNLHAQYEWLEQGLSAWDWKNLDDDARRRIHGLDVTEEGDEPRAQEPTPTKPPEDWQGAQVTELERRLRDDDDGFDTDTLNALITRFAEVIGGRPTT